MPRNARPVDARIGRCPVSKGCSRIAPMAERVIACRRRRGPPASDRAVASIERRETISSAISMNSNQHGPRGSKRHHGALPVDGSRAGVELRLRDPASMLMLPTSGPPSGATVRRHIELEGQEVIGIMAAWSARHHCDREGEHARGGGWAQEAQASRCIDRGCAQLTLGRSARPEAAPLSKRSS